MVETTIGADDLEVKKEVMVNAIDVDSSLDATSQLLAYFSDWRKLKVAVAWFLKLRKTLLEMSHRRHAPQASNVSTPRLGGVIRREKQQTGGQNLSTEDLLEA